jgi:hypothetical protein
MHARPFPDEPQRPGWKPAVEELERLDRDLGDVPGVAGVEMRRRVVAPVHRHHDPIKGADPRHRGGYWFPRRSDRASTISSRRTLAPGSMRACPTFAVESPRSYERMRRRVRDRLRRGSRLRREAAAWTCTPVLRPTQERGRFAAGRLLLPRSGTAAHQTRPGPPGGTGASEPPVRHRGGLSRVFPQTWQMYVSASARPLVLHVCFPRRQRSLVAMLVSFVLGQVLPWRSKRARRASLH